MMRFCVAILALLIACAAAANTTRYVTQAFVIPTGGPPTPVRLYCPPMFFPIGSSVTDLGGGISFSVITVGGVPLGSLPSPNELLGAGYETIFGNKGQPYVVVVTIICVEDPPVQISTVPMQASVPPNAIANGTATVSAFCPSGQVPLGVAYKADSGMRALQYLFGSAQNPVLLDVIPDGLNGPPIGMLADVSNPTQTTRQFSAPLICAAFPGTQTLVVSTPTPPGRSWEAGAVVPGGNDLYGFAFAPGATGVVDRIGLWGTDGSVSTQEEFFKPLPPTKTTSVRGVFTSGRDTRNAALSTKATSRAVIGLLVRPSASAPAPVTTTVVEFYHQTLDHYFITSIAKEISDLDSGVHRGWARTGKQFKAYATGSSGSTTRRPVCREYGNPAVGLDSHFYSASPRECVATLANFNGAWLLESSEVFQMDLPDPTTGACPVGGAPIYRLWNTRADSNHRYTTTTADRDAMVARGYIAEGYGPNNVTLCALL